MTWRTAMRQPGGRGGRVQAETPRIPKALRSLVMSAAESYLRLKERSGQLKKYLPGAGLESIRQPVPHPAGVAD